MTTTTGDYQDAQALAGVLDALAQADEHEAQALAGLREALALIGQALDALAVREVREDDETRRAA